MATVWAEVHLLGLPDMLLVFYRISGAGKLVRSNKTVLFDLEQN